MTAAACPRASGFRRVQAPEHPVPAILEYLPYRKDDHTAWQDSTRHPYFAEHGFAAVRVDIRGTGDSDGILLDEYLAQEQDDAVEVIAWIAEQPWCSGAVGMIGYSWGGFNGLQIAARRPPALKAVVSMHSTDDRYSDDCHYLGGAVLANDMLRWAHTMRAINALPPTPEVVGERWREMWLERLERTPHFVEAWLTHQTYDDYLEAGLDPRGLLGDPGSDLRRGWVDRRVHQCGPTHARASELPEGGTHRALGAHLPRARRARSCDRLPPGVRRVVRAVAERRADRRRRLAAAARVDAGAGGAGGLLRRAPGSVARRSPSGRRAAPRTCGSGSLSAGELVRAEQRDLEALADDVARQTPATLSLSPVAVLRRGRSASGARTGCPTSSPATSASMTPARSSSTAHHLPSGSSCSAGPSSRSRSRRPRRSARWSRGSAMSHPTVCRRSLTYGVLNLTHRNGDESPEELVPGERYTVRVRLNVIGQAVEAGHRLRLALSPTWWPMVWPQPVDAPLVVAPGGSTLSLPVLTRDAAARAGDAACRLSARLRPRRRSSGWGRSPRADAGSSATARRA